MAGICSDSLVTDREAVMVGNILVRGLLAGLAAGVLAFGFARVVGEPQVDRAIAFEQKMDAAKGEASEPELVSRPTQAGFGLLTGVTVYGTSVGGLFALTFAFVLGRVRQLSAAGLSVLLAIGGYIAVILVPMLKYPANPPSVGDPATIGLRTALYFTFLLLSVASMVVAVRARGKWVIRLGAWNASVAAAGLYCVMVGIVMAAMPAVNEVPSAFPAVVLWNFRVASLGLHLVMWTTLGLLFGALIEHSRKLPRASSARRANA
jgi:predicted cobalt transporter CbtA